MLRFLMAYNSLDQEKLARLSGTTTRTVNNWLTGKTPVPQSVINYLSLRRGDLGKLSGDWNGWTLEKDGFLYSPEGWKLSPYNVKAGHFLRINSQHSEIKRLCDEHGIDQPERPKSGR